MTLTAAPPCSPGQVHHPTCFSLFPPILISYSPASQCNPVCDIGGWCSLLEIIHGSIGGRFLPECHITTLVAQPCNNIHNATNIQNISSPTRIHTTTPDRPPANSPPMTNEYSPLRGLIVCNGVESTSPSIHQRVSHQKPCRWPFVIFSNKEEILLLLVSVWCNDGKVLQMTQLLTLTMGLRA